MVLGSAIRAGLCRRHSNDFVGKQESNEINCVHHAPCPRTRPWMSSLLFFWTRLSKAKAV